MMARRLLDWSESSWGESEVCSVIPTLGYRLDACAVRDETVSYRLNQLSASSARVALPSSTPLPSIKKRGWGRHLGGNLIPLGADRAGVDSRAETRRPISA